MEYEDAWDILDYYGLDTENIQVPKEDNMDVYLRSRLFMKQMAYVPMAKDVIMEDLAKNPFRSKIYVFAFDTDDKDIVETYNNRTQYNDGDAVSLIRDDRFDDRKHEWLSSARFRQILEDTLQDERLEAKFITNNWLARGCQVLRQEGFDLKENMCAVAFGKCKDDNYEHHFGFAYKLGSRFVLEVTIPRAPKRPRIGV